VRQAIDYLGQRVGAYDYNLLDPKWGIIQKLTGVAAGTVSVRAEIQAVLDYARARRNVPNEQVTKARVYAPGALYPLDGTLYIPDWVEFVGEIANYDFFGACLWGMSGFNSGAGGDLVRVKSTVDPTSGAAFWGGTFFGFNLRGAPDGSVNYGFNTVNETANNVELQDTACVDFLSAIHLSSGGLRLYGGVPNYVRRFRPYCLNGPGITLVGNVGRHNITHLQEISGDQCNGGLVRLENWADDDVLVVTAMKSERAAATHAFNHATTDAFYATVAGWKDAGHDGQKHAITFNNCTGGRVVVNGVHHISAWNAKQLFTYSGDTFTVPTKSELTEGMPIRFAANTGGVLPTGLTAATDYYVHVLTAKTFKITANVGDVGTGPYIAPTGGSGTWFADPGYLTAGDVFGLYAGAVPNIVWDGANVRYMPWPGNRERIGDEPRIIRNVPTLTNTGATRYQTFPREQMSGRVLRDVLAFVGTNPSGTHPLQFIIGDTVWPMSDLNEDALVGAAGGIPVLGLREVDGPANSQIAMLRANGGAVHLTAVNETDGSFQSWMSFQRNGDGTVYSSKFNYDAEFGPGVNIKTDAGTGTSFGETAAQRVGMHGSQSVQAGSCPADATDLATAITLLNFIKQAGINKGFWRTAA
jgi:hypothetical protein